jgi:hypothetical protein
MPRASLQCLAVMAALAVAACDNPTHASLEGTDLFGGNTLESYTAVPSSGGAAWSIASDQLTGTGPADNSLLLWNGVSFGNGFVETTSSRVDDGGLVLKFQNDSSYYFMALRDDGAPNGGGSKNLAIIRRTRSGFSELWSTDLAWPRGSAHSARFEATGDTLRAWFDNVQVGKVSEPGASSIIGALGLRHNGPNATWVSTYDQFHWKAPL